MTEEQWLAATDPVVMARFLKARWTPDSRKSGLVGCALYRRSWALLTDERCRKVIEVAERFVDGLARKEELEEAQVEAGIAELWWEAASDWQRQDKFHCTLLRDVFGPLPFRAVPLDPRWLTDTLKQLAHAAYQERKLPEGWLDAGRLAVLADALEEAGCSSPDLLGHLREPSPAHVRGCWCVDLLLKRA